MDRSFSALMGLVRQTVADPRAGARRVIAMDLGMAERWQAMLLGVILNVLLGQVLFLLDPRGAAIWSTIIPSPMAWAALELLIYWMVVHLLFRVGRALGGTGSFPDIVLVTAWYLLVWFLMKVALVALVLVLPPFAPIATIMIYALMMWIVLHLVAEVHGFASLGQAAAGILITALALLMAMALILSVVFTLLGIAPEELV